MIRDLCFCFSVLCEFLRGIWFFRTRRPAVTVFGSARFSQDHPYCKMAYRAGELLAQNGFEVITGGGPAIMEAANRGAFDAKGFSTGINIVIPLEQRHNPFVRRAIELKYFFTRKFLLIRYSNAFIIFPGGMGTMDELAEVVTLIQTGKRRVAPVVLVNREYWAGFLTWLADVMVAQGALRPTELQVFKVVDTAEEAVAYCVSKCSAKA